ncbi:MAG: hypothetical protein V8Q39_07330 [Anaerovoracaceae bacterium]
MSFNYGVSSEPKYDKLTVKLDDEIIADGISGITENSCHEKELEAGSHTLSLSYEKDVSTDLNEDCGYISDIVISKLCQHVNRTEQSYTEATCTEPAFTVYLCSDCGKSFSVIDEDNAALGHVYGENGFCMRDGCNARTFESFFYGMNLEYENDSTYPWTVNEDYDAIISGNAKAENTYQFSQLKLTANRAGTLSFDFEPEITSGDTYSSLIVTKNQENGKTVKSAEKISADLNAGDTYTLKYLSGYIKPFSYAKVKNITFTANECRHENTTSAASPKDGAQHTLTVTCSDCGASVSTSDEPHDMNYTHISGMSKHRAYCPTCGYDTEESCDSTGTDGTCSKCGYNDAEGSETNPYLISTADDLKKLAVAVNSGENQAGKYYKLTEDLELPGNFEPIGRYMGNPVYADYAFAGNFDGDGHTVAVNITDRTGSNARVGLFGSVKGTDQSQPAVIKNLTVRGTVLSQKAGSVWPASRA